MAYQIQQGDTLTKIAQQQGTSIDAIMAANPQIQDPNKILAGASLNLPVQAPTAPVNQPIGGNVPSATPATVQPSPAPVLGTPTPSPGQVKTPEQIKAEIEEKTKTLTGLQTELSGMQSAQAAGQAGATVTDYKTLFTLPEEQKKQTYEDIAKSLGFTSYDALLTSTFAKPSKTTTEQYKELYNTAGLSDVKKKIEETMTRINTINDKYTNTADRINENPWLTEVSRRGQMSTLEDKRQKEIGNLTSQQKTLQDLYSTGLTEISNTITRASNDFSTDQKINAIKLDYLTKEAEKKISTAQEEKIARFFPEYLKGKKEAGADWKTAGSAEQGTYLWRVNPSTGQIEKKNIIPPKATTTGTAAKSMFTTAQRNKLASTIGTELGDDIAKAILNGATLEQIRTALRNEGKNPAALDTFDRIVGIKAFIKSSK